LTTRIDTDIITLQEIWILPVIEVKNLRKTYGKTIAVDDISFQVNEGEIFGLLGPNGAGKTTAVECLQGLRQPDSGHLKVLGLNPQTEAKELRRRIGSQLQQSALPDRIRVWEALDLFAAVSPNSPDWQLLMEQWGLNDKRRAVFSSLSGGQRQRLLIALALVNNGNNILDSATRLAYNHSGLISLGEIMEIFCAGGLLDAGLHLGVFRAPIMWGPPYKLPEDVDQALSDSNRIETAKYLEELRTSCKALGFQLTEKQLERVVKSAERGPMTWREMASGCTEVYQRLADEIESRVFLV